MAYKYVLFEKENGIGIVTINRPEALNALNDDVEIDLYNVFEEIEHDPEVRVVILTGSGEKAIETLKMKPVDMIKGQVQ